ncbi:pancreatic triacylglycerol lipase-like [Zophobas morio]|uniref:pancreatic triacylglycerol lipase-like n=1 Tax=Zophobas morio TaxID=2755281 RepID=UPI003083D670
MWKQILFHTLLFIVAITGECDDDEIDISSLSDEVKQDISNICNQLNLTSILVKSNVTADKICYYLFSKGSSNYEKIDTSNPKQFNANSFVVVLIHGWTENRSTLWYELLKNKFKERASQYYVVETDWSEYTKLNYVSSSYSAKVVGGFIGEFVVKLIKDRGVSIKNILIIGHSLGGQVASFVGKTVFELLKEKLPRIIALDPAGPLFNIRPENERLNPNDAQVVHVIHTNGGVFGFLRECGTIDFFPNGGSHQNGCLKTILTDVQSLTSTVLCDHHRSWEYLIEGLTLEEKFKSRKCSSYVDYGTTKITCTDEYASLGVLNLTSTGKYYLDTNSKSPFSK